MCPPMLIVLCIEGLQIFRRLKNDLDGNPEVLVHMFLERRSEGEESLLQYLREPITKLLIKEQSKHLNSIPSVVNPQPPDHIQGIL